MVVMGKGERIPLLLKEDGIPLFLPTAWLTVMRRAAYPSANTLQANCYALKFLYMWAADQGIDIEERMLSGQFLQQHEIGNLADAASRPLENFEGKQPKSISSRRVVSLERVRMALPHAPKPVASETKTNRLRTVAQYLRWLGDRGINDIDLTEADKRRKRLGDMSANLLIIVPPSKGRNVVGHREAPSPTEMDRLLAVLEPASPDNPWRDVGLRMRNRLLVHMIYGLGIRRGETLGIKITDHIDWRGNRILIARNADDPEDPRARQPLVKTRDRFLPVKDKLMDMMREYVTYIRAKIPGAKRHQFLFVSHQTGKPLSDEGLNKVFRTLRERVVWVPENLTPHLLRHGWNDAFSRLIDNRKIDPVREAQMRSEMMGWSPTSGMAATYNKRKIREDAERISLAHQRKLGGEVES